MAGVLAQLQAFQNISRAAQCFYEMGAPRILAIGIINTKCYRLPAYTHEYMHYISIYLINVETYNLIV
jgi:hypothetical protein